MSWGIMAEWMECPEWLLAYLCHIEEELCRVRGNIEEHPYNSPFANTSNKFANDVFSVQAYSWDDEEGQEWNFAWRDLRVSWYKHLRRCTRVNRVPAHVEAVEMLNECLESLWSEEHNYLDEGDF